jgi:hypothetical protein
LSQKLNGSSTGRRFRPAIAVQYEEAFTQCASLPTNERLGALRRRVDLETPTYRGSGTVTGFVGDRGFTAAGLASGLVRARHRRVDRWRACEPANGGGGSWRQQRDRDDHAPRGAGAAAGETCVIRAGCEKRIETCGAKFANVANFRGIPPPWRRLRLPPARPGLLAGGGRAEPMPTPPYSRDRGETGPREVLAEGVRKAMSEIARRGRTRRAAAVSHATERHRQARRNDL